MTRVIVSALTTIGLLIAGIVMAIVTTAAIEGVRSIPDPVASICGVSVLLGSFALAGRVAVDVATNHALRSIALAVVALSLLGWLVAAATEGHGEGVEPVTILQLAAGLGVLLAVPTVLVNRRRSSTSRDPEVQQ